MYPILFHFGPVIIHTWGFMLAIGIIVSTYLAARKFVAEGGDSEDLLNLVILASFGGLIGARLFYVFFYQWDYFAAHPMQIIFAPGGWDGLVWYGGFAGGLLFALIYVLRKHLNFWKTADILAPYLAMAYAIVRIGCFLNGCCYGKVTTMPWSVVFPVVDDLSRHPTQLYSSFLNFLIFLFLLYLYPRRRFNGQIFITYLGLYSVYRFVVEFFRENLLIGPYFTIAQWIALGLFGFCLVLLILLTMKKKLSRFS